MKEYINISKAFTLLNRESFTPILLYFSTHHDFHLYYLCCDVDLALALLYA